MQEYLKTPGMKTEEVLNIFKWKGNQTNVVCQLCQNHLDNQPMAFRCKEIKKQITFKVKKEDIYGEEITLETAQELMKIVKERGNYLKIRKTRNKKENDKKKPKCTEIVYIFCYLHLFCLFS